MIEDDSLWSDDSQYPRHRANARAMTDDRLVANYPDPGLTGSWARAMREEAELRGLDCSPEAKLRVSKGELRKNPYG